MPDIPRLAAAHESSLPAEQQTIAELIELEQREKLNMGFSDHVAAGVTALVGSMYMVWLNLLWFAAWVGLHLAGVLDFDPYPFGLLTMIVSLEAIFFSLFVLIAQNRQAQIADKRAKLDLQVNLIAEREVTKLIEMVANLNERLGVDEDDPEARHMQKPTSVRELTRKMDRVESVLDPHANKGPISAADAEA
jgi:uncharacterized membrane protein